MGLASNNPYLSNQRKGISSSALLVAQVVRLTASLQFREPLPGLGFLFRVAPCCRPVRGGVELMAALVISDSQSAGFPSIRQCLVP